MGTLSMRCDDKPLHDLIMNTFNMRLLTSHLSLFIFLTVFFDFFIYSHYKPLPAMYMTGNF